MKQFNKLIEFRQAVYDHGLARFADAQFDLVDALLFSPPIRSFPELSLSAAFRRQWHSAYAAIEEGKQDWEWLEPFFIHQIPPQGLQVFSLDGTSWLHSAAKAMADRQYVYSPTKMVNSRSIGIGHPYSVLAWVPERNSSWAPAVSVRRAPSDQSDVEMGVDQVKLLCRERAEEMKQALHLIVADAKYGNHRFLGPLKEDPCGIAIACCMASQVPTAAKGAPESMATALLSRNQRRGGNPPKWWNWKTNAGARSACGVGTISMPGKMPAPPSASSWSRPTWSGRNPIGPSGWAINHRLSRNRESQA